MTIKKWMKQFICLLAIFSLFGLSFHVYVSLSFFSTRAEETTPSISIENMQSYPKVGGEWTVSLSVKGTADLIITAVEGTTWSTQIENDCDLVFNCIKNSTKTFDTIWRNDSVIVRNFSSTTLVQEVSKVKTLGKHVLQFKFGTETVFAYNDASNWWNSNWGYRKKIEINKSQVHGELLNFPILLNISDVDLQQKAESNGYDITFVSYEDNSTKYPHEIESYTDGNLSAWIKIPRVSSTKVTHFWMYYNNSDCTSQENKTAVWNEGYVGVWHLNENFNDSTQYQNNGTGIGTPKYISGRIAGAYGFDGNLDAVNISHDLSLRIDNYTIECWVNASSIQDNWAGIIGKHYGTNNEYMFQIDGEGDDVVIFHSGDSWDSNIDLNEIDDAWTYLSITRNDNTETSFYNGFQRQQGTFSTDPDQTHIGNLTFAQERSGVGFNGSIDEIRISSVARNTSWIQTTYNSILNQSLFINLDKEESAAPFLSNPSPSNGDIHVTDTPGFFEITVFDPNPDLLNIRWRTNQSGIWETFNITNGTGSGVVDGTYQVTNTTWVSCYDKMYWWSVNVTDGVHWTNETYTFTMHQYNPEITSFNLTNETGCKLNNKTGNLDVGKEYIFSINLTDKNGWDDINYINLSCWYDNGDDNSIYNQTNGGNYNLRIQYENTTGLAKFRMLWPDDESDLVIENCSETIFNQTTRIINFSFTPGNQTRCATSNQTWNPVENALDDSYSWNLNCTITDSSENKDYYKSEYGVNWHSTITAPDLVEITGAPGRIEEANEDFPITFTCNSDYELVIYLETNLTQIGGSDIIALKDNLRLLATADASDDIIENTNFSGSGENHSITIENTTAALNNEQRTINTRFELSIPFGTWGTYSARIVKKIYRK